MVMFSQAFSIFATVGVAARLDGDAVVAYAHETVGDAHVAAGGGIDTVGIGPFGIFIGVFYRDAVYHHIVAECRVDGPEGRVDEFYVLDENIGTFEELYKRRTEHAAFQSPFVIVRYFQAFVGLFPHTLQFVFLVVGQCAAILFDDFLYTVFPFPPFEARYRRRYRGR